MRDLGTHTSHLSRIVMSAMETDGCDVVFLAGHLDLNTAPHVQSTVLGDEGLRAPRLVLDLSGLELLDSSGIGALVQVNRAVSGRDAQLEFVTDSPHLRKLFKISGLDTMIPIHETLQQALGDPDDPTPLSTAG